MVTPHDAAADPASELASELRLAVMRLRRRLAAERHPDNELGSGSMAVLGLLARAEAESPGADLTVGELADAERVRPPSMSRTVRGLVEGGYVERRACDEDGRQVRVRLTGAGRATLLADRRRRDAWLAVRLAELTDDDRAALRAAAPILEGLATA